MEYKYLAYFFILICFCHVFVNSALENIYKDIFKEDIKHKEIYWLIDLILIILFYSFLKANLLVFIINLFIIVFLILAYFNTYILLDKCDTSGKLFKRFIVISLLFLGIYLYLNKNSTLGDCS